MEKLFLEARYNGKIELNDSIVSMLPESVTLSASVQFLDSVEAVKSQLISAGKKVVLVKGAHSKYPGQILGCDIMNEKINISTDCILFIGTGRFHPIAFAYRYDVKVFLFNPFENKITEISDGEIMGFRKNREVSLTKFHSADTIGIIKTIKPGQSVNQEHISNLKSQYPEKSFYEFLSDDIDFIQLNNFNFINCWVNTACPRIAVDDHDKLDKPIINITDLAM